MIDEKKLIEELEKWMNDTAYLKEKYSGATQFKDRTGDNIMYAHAEIAHDVISEVIGKINEQQKVGEWIPCSDRLPDCCGYPVLLAVENTFGQRSVCKAFTNYMKEGKLLFHTNEKEYCSELTSSELSNAWKPIAWQPLPEPYKPDSVDTEKPEWKDRMMQTFLGGRR